MRASILIVVAVLGLLTTGFTSIAKAEDREARPEKIDMTAPPFWMSSYEEFNDLRPDQKEFYLEKLLPVAGKVPGLEKLTKEKLKEASEWYQSWNSLRRKLYEACHGNSSLSATCEQAADVRIAAINMYANQKQENRHAERAEKKKKTASGR